jgi:hypothetical protein
VKLFLELVTGLKQFIIWQLSGFINILLAQVAQNEEIIPESQKTICNLN